jgi:DNA-binding NtrC family response regulator
MSTQQKKLLIVDDEAGIRDSLRLLLKNHFEVLTAENGAIGVQKAKDDAPDIILLDLHMPELDGLATLKAIKSNGCDCPVIMLTAAGSVESAVEAMKEGAKDFLTKPFDIEALTNLMLDLLTESSKQQVKNTFQKPVSSSVSSNSSGSANLVGQSSLMQALRDRIAQVAKKDATVLITGESGTGKEVVARLIHESSKRSDKPFVAINCAAIPESLIESELFGHEKGSFTGAIETKIGQCEVANGGTLFLDEIGELSLAIQVKLLRFLQEQEFYRVGSSKPTKVDVRIICATNRNLEKMVESKTFRQDLFYRINVIDI